MNFLKRLFGGGSSPSETKADTWACLSAERDKLMAESAELMATRGNHVVRLHAIEKKMKNLVARAKKLERRYRAS